MPINDPPHVAALTANHRDVLRLLRTHRDLSSRVGGRTAALQALNKSAIVLLTACWEAFVEDLASNAFDYLMDNCPDAVNFPLGVRARITAALRQDPDPENMWNLAGEGWRRVMEEYRDKNIARFHNPTPDQVDKLFEKLVAFHGLSDAWRWKGMGVATCRQKLERMLEIRGGIAHRVRATRNVRRPQIENFTDFVWRLAVISNNELRSHLLNLTGRPPWVGLTFVPPRERGR